MLDIESLMLQATISTDTKMWIDTRLGFLESILIWTMIMVAYALDNSEAQLFRQRKCQVSCYYVPLVMRLTWPVEFYVLSTVNAIPAECKRNLSSVNSRCNKTIPDSNV